VEKVISDTALELKNPGIKEYLECDEEYAIKVTPKVD
jgi:hypothetical protein